jgi:acyl-coenzyme A thioesterase PaaI-like protein
MSQFKIEEPSSPALAARLRVGFRSVWQAQLKAEGTVVRRGHTIGYVECTSTDEENRLIAKAASTCMALRGQKAEGR